MLSGLAGQVHSDQMVLKKLLNPVEVGGVNPKFKKLSKTLDANEKDTCIKSARLCIICTFAGVRFEIAWVGTFQASRPVHHSDILNVLLQNK